MNLRCLAGLPCPCFVEPADGADKQRQPAGRGRVLVVALSSPLMRRRARSDPCCWHRPHKLIKTHRARPPGKGKLRLHDFGIACAPEERGVHDKGGVVCVALSLYACRPRT